MNNIPKPFKLLLTPIVKESDKIIYTDKTTCLAKVEAVGEGCHSKVGDVVVIKKTSLKQFDNEDGQYLLLDQEDILGLYNN